MTDTIEIVLLFIFVAPVGVILWAYAMLVIKMVFDELKGKR